ncbi:MAG: 50S ribosomal protein L6 [Gammaproteobacteria bacterium RIFCSPHIGHO2_12_FULL_45_12]|nr:MAG: 50S ribosomal protein L6 [Gammaproteobacteria bacterium RIFCSPHIGHO2_12_FULL_45_12]
MSISANRTSRVGRKPVVVPSGVEVKLHENTISIKGPKGILHLDLHPYVNVQMTGNEITVAPVNADKLMLTGTSRKLFRSIAGTIRAKINNVMDGVTKGIERKLNLIGVGYKAQSKGKVLSLSLGFSHPTDFTVPEGIIIETPTPTEILIKGVDAALVGEAAASIRRIRPPEPYKGKGVRYSDEVVVIKETKKK